MERDAMIAYGASQFLKERFVESADKYPMRICNACGIIASQLIGKEIYICHMCGGTNTSLVVIPYACKLMIQELMSIGIFPRIKVRNLTE
jgi:DNA-directed RNA polymerase II subunit RPB2